MAGEAAAMQVADQTILDKLLELQSCAQEGLRAHHEENALQMWDAAGHLRQLAKDILNMLDQGGEPMDVLEPPELPATAYDLFAEMQRVAAEMRRGPLAPGAQGQGLWRIVWMARRVEEILEEEDRVHTAVVSVEQADAPDPIAAEMADPAAQAADVDVAVGDEQEGVPEPIAAEVADLNAEAADAEANSEATVTVTAPTQPSGPAGTAIVTHDTWDRGSLPEEVDNQEVLQDQQFQMTCTLQQLASQSLQQGEKEEASQHFEELLRMQRWLSRYLPNQADVAGTLDTLGQVYLDLGDRMRAKRCLEEYLEIQRSGHHGSDNMDVAKTLDTLGRLSLEEGNWEQGKQHLEESLRMKRAVHGVLDNTDVADTVGILGQVGWMQGDLNQARQHLEECLRMKRVVHGDSDNLDVSKTLDTLGQLCLEERAWEHARQYLEESLQMKQRLHISLDHSDVERTLGLLGQANLREADIGDDVVCHFVEKVELELRELQARDAEPHLIASKLNALGWLHVATCDYRLARQSFVESLQILPSPADGSINPATLFLEQVSVELEDRLRTESEPGTDVPWHRRFFPIPRGLRLLLLAVLVSLKNAARHWQEQRRLIQTRMEEGTQIRQGIERRGRLWYKVEGCLLSPKARKERERKALDWPRRRPMKGFKSA